MMRVLVTGGASGIGHAIAKRFLAGGAQLLICDADGEALEQAKETLPGVATMLCDVSDSAQIDRLFEAVAAQLGGLDVLVNNVGIGGPTTPAEQLASADWQRVMDVNLTGTFEVTKRAIPLIRASKGTIIVMSSAAGKFGYPNRLPYAVSKWGLVGFTKTLSMELGGDGVSVNAILPGAVGGERFEKVIAGRAELSGQSYEDALAEGMKAQSLKHITPPEHVADLAWFLATPAGRSISGQALSIDCDQQHG